MSSLEASTNPLIDGSPAQPPPTAPQQAPVQPYAPQQATVHPVGPTVQYPAQPAAQYPGQPQPIQQETRPVAIQPMVMPAQQPAMQPAVPQYTQQPPPAMGSGGVVYYAQPQPGIGQIAVMPGYPGPQPNYNYTPNSYLYLSAFAVIICGLFSPMTLCCSIPAVVLSIKSKQFGKDGNIKRARKFGLVAVILSLVAIVFALVLAAVLTGVFVPVICRLRRYNNYYYNSGYYGYSSYYGYYC